MTKTDSPRNDIRRPKALVPLLFVLVTALLITAPVVEARPRAPRANFSASPTAGEAPLDVQFRDLSKWNPTTWLWSFGDGTTSQLRNPLHRYLDPGSYTVRLTVSNGAGSNTATRADYIVVRPPFVDTTPPSVPGDFQASPADTTSIMASWSASTDNVGVSGYQLYKDASPTETTTLTSYTYQGLACGVSYSVAVAAFDAAGNLSGLSGTDVFLSCDGLAPATSIPVLLYHQMDTGSSSSVSSADFDAQLAYLKQQGYHSIGTREYAAWRADPDYRLPLKPVLITFDDGQSSAVAATPILQRYGFRATMFVVTGFATNTDNRFGTFYLSWSQLHDMDTSGAWEWGFHAGEHGHDYFSQYRRCPYFYPCVFPDETFEQYKTRVTTDVDEGMASLSEQLPDWAEFAVPWSEYGQYTTNDARVLPFLLNTFRARFNVVFVEDQSDQVYAKLRYRFTVEDSTTMSQLTAALEDPAFGY